MEVVSSARGVGTTRDSPWARGRPPEAWRPGTTRARRLQASAGKVTGRSPAARTRGTEAVSVVGPEVAVEGEALRAEGAVRAEGGQGTGPTAAPGSRSLPHRRFLKATRARAAPFDSFGWWRGCGRRTSRQPRSRRGPRTDGLVSRSRRTRVGRRRRGPSLTSSARSLRTPPSRPCGVRSARHPDRRSVLVADRRVPPSCHGDQRRTGCRVSPAW